MAGKRKQASSESRPLVVVESPAKARTIQAFLGPAYLVKACLGHVRDLPERSLGIDLEHGFEGDYRILRSRGRVLSELRRLSAGTEKIYLAPDPDREGEAIAWHLIEALKLPAERVRRIAFHEITERAVREALEHPAELSVPRVQAQQARRFLDRIVGYKLSPLLWNKVGRGLSAGRVQSVAVRLVVEREREVAAFKSEEYWMLTARLGHGGRTFDASPEGRLSEAAANARLEELRNQPFEVVKASVKERLEPPPPPFTTSLLQQQASLQLGYPAKRTMALAQELYEGIRLGPGGAAGLITYLRTDSFRVAGQALAEVRDLIGRRFGASALPEKAVFRAKRTGMQEAHEAIRPTSVQRTPEELRPYLKEAQHRLYRLIWTRFVASQMKPARFRVTDVELNAGGVLFKARGEERIFDGFRAVLGGTPEAPPLPALATGDRPVVRELRSARHLTEPPDRYGEASLVKALERHGIGRPGTYAPTLSTIQERGYVRLEGRRLVPTELGTLVNDKLVGHFESVVSTGFTARLERDLDRIEAGKAVWTEVLGNFHELFSLDLEQARKGMASEKGREETGAVCEKCGRVMLVRWNAQGRFLGCSGYPDCKEIRRAAEPGAGTCELCQAPMRAKSGRLGRFLSCSRYPECRNTRPIPKGGKNVDIPPGWKEDCDKCGKPLKIRHGRRGGYIVCSAYPACKNTRRFPRAWVRSE